MWTDGLVLDYQDRSPEIDPAAWVAPGSAVIGSVRLAAGSSVWYGSVLRGDTEQITIGAGSNIQDGCVVHADPGFPTTVGSGVSVGHRAVLHGCTVEDGALVGMGSVVLNGARIGAGSLVAAGAVVLAGTVVPPGSLVAGVPGRVRRELTEPERADLGRTARQYVERSRAHAESARPSGQGLNRD
ncbi:carbonic anhydrase/acetyltransferase-like protein (isoleucine patch superfamily) [Micromonospora pisi]|uniref:Carbonic anhydrase/acetyltransferase-like protein (Isoleucine patch superfamily) n=1 Tax=Micromonospora pisi TaxID=589240 RepID=A0A495JU62_9ACTN|nr:gamma carbonic anhydrase family protein [Micromonospora pisi]RKR92075.1 carbonic anhydrase/acetyltransferase-like protein (isoleucine patch superfamily) [Micromonospora pisi]